MQVSDEGHDLDDEDAPQPQLKHSGPELSCWATPTPTPRPSPALASSQGQALHQARALASSQGRAPPQPQALATSQSLVSQALAPSQGQVRPPQAFSAPSPQVQVQAPQQKVPWYCRKSLKIEWDKIKPRRKGPNGSFWVYSQFYIHFGLFDAFEEWEKAEPEEIAPLAAEPVGQRDGRSPGEHHLQAATDDSLRQPPMHTSVEGEDAQGGPSASRQEPAVGPQLQPAQLQQKSLQPPTSNQGQGAMPRATVKAPPFPSNVQAVQVPPKPVRPVPQVPPKPVRPVPRPGGQGLPAPQPVAQAALAASQVQVPAQPAPAAPQAPVQPAAQPPVAAAASQAAQEPAQSEPAGPVALGELQKWTDTAFYKTFLPDQHAALTNVQFQKPAGLRKALVLARTTLYKYLPLLEDDLIKNGSLKKLLGVPEALFVTAEVIPRVSDHSQADKDRVDFFAYLPSGEVHRYHPGSTPSKSAKPEVMRTGSHLFQFDVAASQGVGRALHLVPPGFASASSRGNDGEECAVFTLSHLDELSEYDMQRNSAYKLLQVAVTRVPALIPPTSYDGPGGRWRLKGDVDITDGTLTPWWLPIAASGRSIEIIGGGIFSVEVAITGNEKPFLRVRNSRGMIRVFFTSNGLSVD